MSYGEAKRAVLELVRDLAGKIVEADPKRRKPNNGGDKPPPSERHRRYRHPSEGEHRVAEQFQWKTSNGVSYLTFVAAVAAVVFAIKTYQQTKRQAYIAQGTLIASTRARLKITAVSGVTARRVASYPIVWISFDPAYINFGQNPAENIYFFPHIFIIGAGPKPKATCDADRARHLGMTPDLVFPRDSGDQKRDFQIPLDDLSVSLAKLEAENPGLRLDYLGVVGCLTYQSADSPDVYVTGFVADIQTAQPARPYVSAYESLTKGTPPFTVKLRIVINAAWSD